MGNVEVTITVERDNTLDEVKRLIKIIMNNTKTHDTVTVLEAPKNLNYLYPFPVLTIINDQLKHRLYGNDAVARLQDLANGREIRP